MGSDPEYGPAPASPVRAGRRLPARQSSSAVSVHPFPAAAIVRAADVARPPAAVLRLLLVLGAILSLLIVYKLAVLKQHPKQVFGETMMLVYYGYALPLSLKIGRGFYEDGIWADGGFMPYSSIGGLTWREEGPGHAGGDAPHAGIRAAAGRARQLLRRRSAPATRQDRRARHSLHWEDARSGAARRAG